MTYSIDYNDIETRIKLLYKATDSYINKTSFVRPQILKEDLEKSPGKTTFKITIGGRKMTDEDTLETINYINQMVDSLANLKDNTTNALKFEGISKKQSENIINSYIDNSLELCIITDLDNQNKHGYPLRRTRSKFTPLIRNIRPEMTIPLFFGWTDLFNNGKVLFEADIIDNNGQIITTFRKIIERSVELWENFYLQYLPSKSKEIKDRIIREEKRNQKLQEYSELEKLVLTEIEKPSNWRLITNPDNLSRDMFLKVFDKNTDKELFRGVSISNIYVYRLKRTINVYNIFLLGEQRMISIDEYNWIIFYPNERLILKKIKYFYFQLNEMNRFASRDRFAKQRIK